MESSQINILHRGQELAPWGRGHIDVYELKGKVVSFQSLDEMLCAMGVSEEHLLRTVRFIDCIFQNFNIELTVQNYEFIGGCQFLGEFGIRTKGYIKIVDAVFQQNASFVAQSSETAQLDFYNVSFTQKVVIKDFVFNPEFSDSLSRIASKFNKVNFNDELSLEEVAFPLEMTMDSVVWPKKIQAERDVFRQLKRVMAHQHNFIQSAIFHSYEMREYEKELAKESWSKHFEDKLLFAFNKYASNFSLSWFRPFLWIVGLSLVFYAAAWCIQPNSISFNGFFEFLNPFSWNAKKQFEGVYWLWFLHKLVVVPLVYLMIVALKRKTKL